MTSQVDYGIIGSTGQLGRALIQRLEINGYSYATDHTNEGARIVDWLDEESRDFVFPNEAYPKNILFCAGKVGGIRAQSDQRGMFVQNMAIGTNVLECVKKHYPEVRFVNISSTCLFADSEEPYHVENWNVGLPPQANYGYGLAKRNHIQMLHGLYPEIKDHATIILPNLFGQYDNYDQHSSHVVAALIRKIYTAKKFGDRYIDIMGDGKQVREVMDTYTAAKKIVQMLEMRLAETIYMLGSPWKLSINEMVREISEVFDWNGVILRNPKAATGPINKQTHKKYAIRMAHESFKDAVKHQVQSLGLI